MSDHKTHKTRSIEKIKSGMILERLIKHYDGDVELSATQVTVGLALLKKCLPDLKSIEHSGAQEYKVSLDGKSAKVITDTVRRRLTK